MKRAVPLLLLALLVAGLGLAALGLLRSGQGPQVFGGTYVNAFETSAFYPGSTQCDPSAPVYWLAAGPSTGFFDRLSELSRDAPPDWRYRGGLVVRVRFEGLLSPPGTYGHLGGYEREVTVTRLIEMAPAEACK